MMHLAASMLNENCSFDVNFAVPKGMDSVQRTIVFDYIDSLGGIVSTININYVNNDKELIVEESGAKLMAYR